MISGGDELKFKSIRMKNFMRYKGENTIVFSCDPVKNVTVILGDNTVGKTTIAQAFRWGLYGAISTDRRKSDGEYMLLSNDVLIEMDADSRASVLVEIVAEDAGKRYTIQRETGYTRAFPKMIAREYQKKLQLHIADHDSTDEGVEINENKAEEVINELFPKDLSHYFLFDGERWNDVTIGGVRENIKDSVHILTGLSSYQKALWHLKDMGSGSVIKKFKGKITGTGNLYDSLDADRKRMEREIEKCKEQIQTIDINLGNYEQKCRETEQYLEDNRNTEILQAKNRQLCIVKKSQEERCINNYKMLVHDFSDKAYMLFAQPMIQAALEMVKAEAGVRRDIPHMRQASIDFILKSGTCICGTKILPDSKELDCLMEQRNYLPPADIGSLLGEFERTANRFKNRSAEARETFLEEAAKVDFSIRDYEDTCNELALLEKKMDEHINFGEQKRRLLAYRDEMQKLSNQKGTYKGQIESFRKRIEHVESEMKSQEAQSAENEKWRGRVTIAENLYDRMKKDFVEKEQKIFLELNRQIQSNFNRMFNAKDKKIELDKQYNIKMFYKSGESYREEQNLSEGEKIARNFAFIVTIMEYSRKKKAENNNREEVESDTLPIVLDGPFSKLGDENIHLIAGVLPEVSEQVIIFMLKKDWVYTGLDEYVGASYLIDKAPNQVYSSIRRTGGIV